MTLGVNIWIYFLAKDIKISLILGTFSLIMILGIFIYEKACKIYMKDIFIQLSNMLSSIIDMRDNEVFSTIEDTLFSKLQYQTIKLVNILKTQNSQIEKDKNEIKKLVSDIAHQLKTPSTNLKIYEEFLQDENLSEEERKEFSSIVMISLDRLIFLVESMIKMSRLEGGVVQIKYNDKDLKDTLLMAIMQIQKKARNKNIEVEFISIDNVKVSHDKNWMSEAFFNIL